MRTNGKVYKKITTDANDTNWLELPTLADALTTNGVLYADSNGNIDSETGFEYNASTNTLSVANLEVTGTTTTLNTATVQVEDNNITLNYGGNNTTAEGSGLEVDRTGTHGSLIYNNAAATRFKIGDLGAEVEIADISTAQTLTNKTIDGDSNTVQDLALSSLKTNLTDASKFLVRDASGIVVSNTKAVPTGDVVGTSDSQSLSNKTIDADQNTITNIENADIKAAAAIALDKLAATTASRALVSDASGFVSASAITATELAALDGVAPFQKLAYVDKAYAGPTSDGSVLRPYTTIQAAVNGLGAPVDAADEKKVRKLIITGGSYDEDVTIPQGNWQIIPHGFVHLGAGDLNNYASTTPRKLQFEVTPDNRFGTSRPSLSIEGNPGYTGSTHMAYNGSGFHISGDLDVEIIKIVGGFSDVELNLTGVKVGGNTTLTLTGGATGNVHNNIDRCYFVGTFGASTWNVYTAKLTEWDGLITCAGLGFLHLVDIGGGATFTSWSSSVVPNGFFESKVAGTLTTGAGNWRPDGATLFNSSPTLAGGATLALQEKVADATNPGVVSTAAQTFAGQKTLSSAPILSSVTASRALVTDASSVVTASATTDTEIGYVSGVTSSIQTQLNGKANTALSNLATVAINTTLVSDTNNTDDLGTDAIEWKDAWVHNVKHDDASNPNLTIATTGNNGNVILSPHGTGVTDASSKKIQNVADPTAAQDAATKAYVDGINLSPGSFSGAESASNSNVTGFAFANGTVRGFKALVTVTIDATTDLFETVEILGIQKGASWDIAVNSVGDDTLVDFSITNAGQIQYSSSTYTGFVSMTIKFKAESLGI
jgi:hypothetical protein